MTDHKSTMNDQERSALARGLSSYLLDQRAWSADVFAGGPRTEGICKHIEKELDEIRAAPTDLLEWCDVIILAMDGFWRAGGHPMQLADFLMQKQRINFSRDFPPPPSQDEPSTHIKGTGIQTPRAYPPVVGQLASQESNLKPESGCICPDYGAGKFNKHCPIIPHARQAYQYEARRFDPPVAAHVDALALDRATVMHLTHQVLQEREAHVISMMLSKKCPACSGMGGGESSMGGPNWCCSICDGTGRYDGPDPEDKEAVVKWLEAKLPPRLDPTMPEPPQ